MSSIKKRVKYYIGKFFITEKKDVEQKINEADVVSFDIFDTLIKRNLEEPTDLHELVSRDFYRKNREYLNNYKKKRVEAERKARSHSLNEEVTLKDIYDEFESDISKYREDILKIEKQLELNLCCPNKEISDLYNKALQLGKKVVITSDIYLPEIVIRDMLTKCGYENYDKLYLSSTYLKTKSEGSLFDVVNADYKDKKIVHIGDDFKADYFRAKKAGINPILIDGEKSYLKYWKKWEKLEAGDLVLYKQLRNFLNNHVPKEYDDTTAIGHEILGPMLLGFCKYLHEKIREDKIEKLFFLSREGKIIMDAYRILYPKQSIPISYLYVSRQALVVPLLAEAETFDDVVEILKCFMIDPRLKTIREICSLDEKQFRIELKQINIDENRDIYSLSDKEKDSLFNVITNINREYFCKQREYISQYLEEVNFTGNVGVVDVGWVGTMQLCLQKLISDPVTKIHGYYYGVRNMERDNFYSEVHRQGYLFDNEKNYKFNLMIRWTTTIFEVLFLNKNGSLRGYAKEKNQIIPDFKLEEYTKEEKINIKKMQDAALNFCKEIGKEYFFEEIEDLTGILFQIYSNFAGYPSLRTVNLLGEFSFLNVSIQKVIPVQDILWYFVHPRKFLYDFNASCAKIFFLKKLLKIRIPYFDILYFLEGLGVKGTYRRKMYGEKNKEN